MKYIELQRYEIEELKDISNKEIAEAILDLPNVKLPQIHQEKIKEIIKFAAFNLAKEVLKEEEVKSEEPKKPEEPKKEKKDKKKKTK